MTVQPPAKPIPPKPAKPVRKKTRRATERLTMTDVANAAGVAPSAVSL